MDNINISIADVKKPGIGIANLEEADRSEVDKVEKCKVVADRVDRWSTGIVDPVKVNGADTKKVDVDKADKPGIGRVNPM